MVRATRLHADHRAAGALAGRVSAAGGAADRADRIRPVRGSGGAARAQAPPELGFLGGSRAANPSQWAAGPAPAPPLVARARDPLRPADSRSRPYGSGV